MLVRQPAAEKEPAESEEDGAGDQDGAEPDGHPPGRARREPARVRGVHEGHTTAPSPISRKTSGRVSRPLSSTVFLTP